MTWTPLMDELLRKYASDPTKSRDDLATVLGISQGAIRNRERALGIRWRQQVRDLPWPNLFEPMSHAAAWALGLWLTDGHITDVPSTRLAMLTQKERKLLEDVAAVIAPGSLRERVKIVRHKTAYDLVVASKPFIRYLMAFGMAPRKVNSLPNVDLIPKEFRASFVRGLFDGDGTIRVVRGKGNARYLSVGFVSPSLAFLRVVVDMIEEGTGYRPRVYSYSGHCPQIRVNAAPALRIAEWIYAPSTPSTRLARKYAVYAAFTNEVMLRAV